MPTRVSTLHELAKRTARLAGPLQPLSSSILTEAAATITPIDNLRFQRRGDDEVIVRTRMHIDTLYTSLRQDDVKR